MTPTERIERAEKELRLAKLELEQRDSIEDHLLEAFSFYDNVSVKKSDWNDVRTVTLDKYDSDGISVGNKIKDIYDSIGYIPCGFDEKYNQLIIRFKKPY